MDGILHILNKVGLSLAITEQKLQEAQTRITALEAEIDRLRNEKS